MAAVLVLLALAALAEGIPPQAFSRSAWIAAQRRWAHFDGGLEPATRRSRAELLQAAAGRPLRRPRPTPGGPPNLRISDDILEADARSAAQPETEAEVSLAANPTNEAHLVAGYQEDRFEGGGARALTSAVSFDAGQHWQEGLLPELSRAAGGPFERASDPWVAFGADGRVYYATIAFDETQPDNGVTVSASDDGGLTWGAPSIVHLNRNQDFDDKEAVVVDNAAGSPFAGRVYVAWDTVIANQRQVLRIARSDDGGRDLERTRRSFGAGRQPGRDSARRTGRRAAPALDELLRRSRRDPRRALRRRRRHLE
jgi:hypothetical protein